MDNRLTRGTEILVRWVMVASSLFALYTAGFGLFSALTQRSIHWVFMSFPIFLLFPLMSKNKGKVTWIDYLLALGAVASGIYLALTWGDDPLRLKDPTITDTAMPMLAWPMLRRPTRCVIATAHNSHRAAISLAIRSRTRCAISG